MQAAFGNQLAKQAAHASNGPDQLYQPVCGQLSLGLFLPTYTSLDFTCAYELNITGMCMHMSCANPQSYSAVGFPAASSTCEGAVRAVGGALSIVSMRASIS